MQRRPNVFDVGPTLYKCYTNGLYLLGIYLHNDRTMKENNRVMTYGPAFLSASPAESKS